LERLIKIAQKLLVKKNHDKNDGELILTGQLKPLSSSSSQQESSVAFCCVQECDALACFRCSETDKCPEKLFCSLHGPEHDQHESQFFKTGHQLIDQLNSYNIQLMNTALLRAQDRAVKDKEKNQNKQKQVKKRIRELQSAVDNAVEANTLASVGKKNNREKVIKKNKKMLDLVGKRLAKKTKHNHAANRSSSSSSPTNRPTSPDTSSASSYSNIPPIQINPLTSPVNISVGSLFSDPPVQTDHPASDVMLGASNTDTPSIELENITKVTHVSMGGSADVVLLNLKKTVDHLIEGVNDNGQSRRVINFDVCMEESLNISYYKQHLKHLVNIYHISLNPTNWNALMVTDLEGNTKQHKVKRSLFIAAICDSLRLQKIVKVDKIEPRFK